MYTYVVYLNDKGSPPPLPLPDNAYYSNIHIIIYTPQYYG